MEKHHGSEHGKVAMTVRPAAGCGRWRTTQPALASTAFVVAVLSPVSVAAGVATPSHSDTSNARHVGAARAERCWPRTEFVPALCTLSLPAITRVIVERDAQASSTDAALLSDCARFRLSPGQVRRFFNSAYRIDDPNPEHAGDLGPCHAAGRVTFADGRQGHWRIEQIGSGMLWVGDAVPLAVMCVRCNWPPFRQRRIAVVP